MLVFATRSTRHLMELDIDIPQGDCTIQTFSDGELLVRIDQDVTDRHVWVLAATPAPAENILELLFLLNALERAGVASISLLFTHFGYARHDTLAPGQASPIQVITDALKAVTPLKNIYIMHPHNPELLRTFLPFTDLSVLSFFCHHAQNFDVIAAPDKGALPLVQQVAKKCSKEFIAMTKERHLEQITIKAVHGSVHNKKVLIIDDIISTGCTIIEAANALHNCGASSISAAVIHGIFSPGAHERIAESIVENIYVTNTIAQQQYDKIVVTDISVLIDTTIVANSD